jgi:nitrogen fixation NifU-like protein
MEKFTKEQKLSHIGEDHTEIDFRKNHSEKFIEMALRTDRRKRLDNADGYGKRTGDCGDTIEMFLIIENSRLERISFDINGCLNTQACANTVAELAEGKVMEDAWAITPDDVETYLETLPADHKHCAELAVGAFYRALANYSEIKQNSWKKLYQNR